MTLLEAFKELRGFLPDLQKSQCMRLSDKFILTNDASICSAVYALKYPDHFSANENEIWLKITKRWEKYSGDLSYPVPSPNGVLDAKEAYDFHNNKWIGEYGALRIELLDFIINELEKED